MYPKRRFTHSPGMPPNTDAAPDKKYNDDHSLERVTVEEKWIWKVVRIPETSLSAGCKGGPEVQEWFDGIDSLVPRHLAC